MIDDSRSTWTIWYIFGSAGTNMITPYSVLEEAHWLTHHPHPSPQHLALAVRQPLLEHLVASELVAPQVGWHVAPVRPVVEVDAPCGPLTSQLPQLLLDDQGQLVAFAGMAILYPTLSTTPDSMRNAVSQQAPPPPTSRRLRLGAGPRRTPATLRPRPRPSRTRDLHVHLLPRLQVLPQLALPQHVRGRLHPGGQAAAFLWW